MGWLHTAWFWVWSWYIQHGVAGNLAASAILFFGATICLHEVWRKHLAPHIQRTRELHRLMHHVHAEKATELGHDIPE